jgi:hypothetical protein
MTVEEGGLEDDQHLQALSPVLAFLQYPAAVLTPMQPEGDGSLVMTASQLQQVLAQAVQPSAAPASSSTTDSVLVAAGYSLVHIFAYDPSAPHQCLSCCAALVSDCQGATGASSNTDGMLVTGSLKDLGLSKVVQDDTVCSLVSLFDIFLAAVLLHYAASRPLMFASTTGISSRPDGVFGRGMTHGLTHGCGQHVALKLSSSEFKLQELWPK